LLLVVHVRPQLDERRRARRQRESPRTTLDPAEAELYDRLRAWRNSRAQTEGVPPYVLFTNRQLAAILRIQRGFLMRRASDRQTVAQEPSPRPSPTPSHPPVGRGRHHPSLAGLGTQVKPARISPSPGRGCGWAGKGGGG
jgi:hypothetical protein